MLILIILQVMQLIAWCAIWKVRPSVVVSFFSLPSIVLSRALFRRLLSVHLWMHHACHHLFCWSQYMDYWIIFSCLSSSFLLITIYGPLNYFLQCFTAFLQTPPNFFQTPCKILPNPKPEILNPRPLSLDPNLETLNSKPNSGQRFGECKFD